MAQTSASRLTDRPSLRLRTRAVQLCVVLLAATVVAPHGHSVAQGIWPAPVDGGLAALALLAAVAALVLTERSYRRARETMRALRQLARAAGQPVSPSRERAQGGRRTDEFGMMKAAAKRVLRVLGHHRARARDAEDRMQRLFDLHPSPMLAWSRRSGTVVDANPAATRLLVATRDALVGKPLDGLLLPEDPVLFHEALLGAEAQGVVHGVPARLVRGAAIDCAAFDLWIEGEPLRIVVLGPRASRGGAQDAGVRRPGSGAA